jgi:hypothetical protein
MLQMIFLTHDNASTTKAKVIIIHNFPDMLSEEMLNSGILVDSIVTEPKPQFGKTAELYVNPTTKETWYEFINRPLTDSETIQELKSQNAQMILALVNNGLI